VAKKKNSFKFPRVTKKIVLVVLLLLFFNALIAVFGFSFLHENFWFFADKSATCILSDLLFLEGAIVFTVGAFVASGASIFRFGIVVMIIGAILISSSIVIGTFLI